MKKIITFFALAVMASSTFGATLSWNLNQIKMPGTTTNASGYSAYLFITTQSGDFGATPTTVDDITALIKSKGDISPYVAGNPGTSANGMINGATGYYANFTTGDSLSAFAVVFDAASADAAKNYIVTSTQSVSWGGPGGAQTLRFGSQANATWTPVPEPSTAVLALAGLALLLKRRKA